MELMEFLPPRMIKLIVFIVCCTWRIFHLTVYLDILSITMQVVSHRATISSIQSSFLVIQYLFPLIWEKIHTHVVQKRPKYKKVTF